jgi:hypothetical protein
MTQRTDASRQPIIKGTCHVNVGEFADNELIDICAQVHTYTHA